MYRPKAIDSRRSSSSFRLFSISSSVSLYAAHTRTCPPSSIHRQVLQTLALPRRVIASTARRTRHTRRNHDRINKIALASVWMPRSTVLALCDLLGEAAQLQTHDLVTNGVWDPQPPNMDVSCLSNARSRAHPDRCCGIRLDIHVDDSAHLLEHVLREDPSCRSKIP